MNSRLMVVVMLAVESMLARARAYYASQSTGDDGWSGKAASPQDAGGFQSLGFRAEFHQPPVGNREVVRLERTPDLLAVDLDEGVVKSIAVPVEALGDVVELLRFFGI